MLLRHTLCLPFACLLAAEGPVMLERGKPVERELRGTGSHTYGLTLEAGEYLNLVVDQRGIDVLVRVSDPTGKVVLEVDSPNGTNGPEVVSWVTESAGSYKFDIVAEGAPKPGRYEIRVADIHSATSRDRTRVAAERDIDEGDKLRRQGKRATLTKALERYEAALSKWRQIQNREGEANALLRLAVTYGRLEENEKAIALYGEVLPLQRALGDRSGESTTVNNLGLIYSSQGDKEKAIEYYKQSIALDNAVGYVRGQATSYSNIGLAYADLGDYQNSLDA